MAPSPLLHSWSVRASVLSDVAAPLQEQAAIIAQLQGEMEEMMQRAQAYQQRAAVRVPSTTVDRVAAAAAAPLVSAPASSSSERAAHPSAPTHATPDAEQQQEEDAHEEINLQ